MLSKIINTRIVDFLKINSDIVINLTIVAALTFFLFVISPLNILSFNYIEFNYGFYNLLSYSLNYFFIAFLLLSIPIFILNIYCKKIYCYFFTFIFYIAVVNTQFLYGYYGEFDGRGLNFNFLSYTSLSQLIASFAILILILSKKINKIFYFFSLSYLLILLLISYFFLVQNQENLDKYPVAASPEVVHKFLSFSKTQPNYLYILLDEVYGGSTQNIFEDRPDLAKKFAGFTNYTNASALYPNTLPSITSILTGEIYKEGENFNEYFLNSFKKSSLLSKLELINASTGFYIHPWFEKGVPLDSYIPMGSFFLAPTLKRDYLNLLNLSLFKATPDILKSYIYSDNNWIIEYKEDISLYTKESNFFIENINNSNSKITFKFFHSVITHSPIEHNEKGEYFKDNLAKNYENHYNEDTYGFVFVSEVLNELKKLGIYDNTFIIISSDHGRDVLPEKIKSNPALRKLDNSHAQGETVYGTSHVALLIKPFNTRGAFNNSDEPISLGDISPMIISNIDEVPYVIKKDRKFYFSYSSPKFNWNSFEKLPTIHKYEIGNDITNFNEWKQ